MATDNGTAAKAEEKPKSFYDDIENLKKLCDFLRSGQGPPIREALLMEKRVHYLKGTKHLLFASSMPLGMRIIFAHTPDSRHFYCTLFFVPGEKLVNFLVEPKKGTKWPTNLPRFENRTEATAVCRELCKNQFLLRSEKRGKGELGVSTLMHCCRWSSSYRKESLTPLVVCY
jgi:translocation protein SEC62